ncbi:hypothetical protein PMZ80_002371 [Knufia obscura]|uniref:SMP-30/Gluconolactonase/LRE-like region domain-containing protein n=2 Tax=Knufia TaxID=430999 RepID=A0AAN8E9Q0_9EURO|nr:hypothetical protein PMZ80_002371 [Knufia obscura]KAK5948625.1 hypothetical protein OHC33_010384 [Knufia fluminis]
MMLPLLLAAFLGTAYGQSVPDTALLIDPRSLLNLEVVPPPSQFNLTNIFLPPGVSEQDASAKPFHVYDDAFLKIIGDNPTLHTIARSEVDPIFHEAVTWYPATDEVFFVQNAGAKAAGTGLAKSNIIQKISLAQVAQVINSSNASAEVDVMLVDPNPPIINSNGATNYRGQIAFTGEGQGNDTAPAIYLMNPVEPYNATILLNNFHGRQFNSPNDLAVNPRNGELYFTDSVYGYYQDFRPALGLPTQVYRLNTDTGALAAVADQFEKPNGITFSPNGSHAYITDTGAGLGFYGYNLSLPASIYRYDVNEDGTFSNRKLFAYASPGIPDGVHCDTEGNVYSGCGDGVHVWNPAGKLIGKIFTGTTAANFRFVGKGRMVITGQTELFYATLAAEGADPVDEF